MSLFDEFKRRNVFRVGAAYVIASWLVIQVAETLFPLFGYDETPARLVVIVLAIGLVPVLVFAWAFELTPEGLKRERDVDRSRSIAPQTGKRLDRVIMVALALALGYFAFDKFVLDPRRDALTEARKAEEVERARQAGRAEALVESYGDKSIAVLAFQDMSPGKDQAYLSDGIAEELLNLLAKIPELRVISRSSAFSFKGQNLEIPEIARRLNVAHILEGSVRHAGNRVRITAQLIDARSDTHLWSQTYDRTLDDIFAVQDEIASEVVGQLEVTLLGTRRTAASIDPQAYSLYLQARHLSDQVDAEHLEQSRLLYEQALEIDPDYAAAWNGLSVTYFRMGSPGLMAEKDIRSLARQAVDRALAIDPDFAEAWAHSSWLALFHDDDPAAAARDMQRALDLSPAEPWIVGRAAALMFNLGRLDEAIALGDYELSHDPLFMPGYWNQGLRYLAAARWDQAIGAFRTVLRLSPGGDDAWWGIAQALLQQGDTRAALDALQKVSNEAQRLAGLARVHHVMGQAAESDRALRALTDRYGGDWPAEIACVHAYRGETDQAFEWLATAAKVGDTGLHEAVFSRLLDNIRGDPRWLPFLESIGKSPRQLAAIEFEVDLPR